MIQYSASCLQSVTKGFWTVIKYMHICAFPNTVQHKTTIPPSSLIVALLIKKFSIQSDLQFSLVYFYYYL
jgi:hypothetical protein